MLSIFELNNYMHFNMTLYLNYFIQKQNTVCIFNYFYIRIYIYIDIKIYIFSTRCKCFFNNFVKKLMSCPIYTVLAENLKFK